MIKKLEISVVKKFYNNGPEAVREGGSDEDSAMPTSRQSCARNEQPLCAGSEGKRLSRDGPSNVKGPML
jgi:hypothetical protein